MIQNNNISVLPWYTSINEQNHRKSYAYGAIYPLFAPADRLLPFQIIRNTRSNNITSVILYDKTGQQIADITTYMKETGLQIVRFQSFGYDIILYPSILPMPLNQFDGIYYMTLSDGVQTWYSEMFTVVQDVSGYLKIEWWDIENLVFDAGQIVYKNPSFKNALYLCTELGKPDYEFEEDGEERDGYFFPEKQISVKTFRCTILAPEYLCDVMRFIRMADYVHIIDKYGREYDCDTFLITPKWQTQGNLASVEIEFKTNTVVKKIGRGVLLLNNGDFNNDFDGDFYEQPITPIQISLLISSDNVSVIIASDKPVRSDVRISFSYQYRGTTSGSGSIDNFLLNRGSARWVVDTEVGEGREIFGLYDYVVNSKGQDDKTEYSINVIN